MLLVELARMIGARNRADEIAAALGVRAASGPWALRQALADGIAGAAGVDAVRTRVRTALDEAQGIVPNTQVATSERAAAITLLGYRDFASAAETLDTLLRERRESVQVATLSALDKFDGTDAAGLIVRHFNSLTPRARADAAAVLLKRPERATVLLKAIEAHALKQADLDAGQVNQLLGNRDPSVRALARSLLKAPTTNRSDVVESFRPALPLSGDSQRGKVLYEQRCISCHRAASQGSLVGPDFVSVRNAGREKLLLNILDPSREVQPQYVAYLVETKDGQSLLGILASDTPANVTVRQAYGKDIVVDRANIARMTSQGKSLMPDGLEAGMTPQDVADLIAFVESVK
jgi:putative heme-binding domain-containing protein